MLNVYLNQVLRQFRIYDGCKQSYNCLSFFNFPENDLTDLFEGDINLREEKTKKLVLSNQRKRDAQRDRRYLWHSGVVPYEISHDLGKFELKFYFDIFSNCISHHHYRLHHHQPNSDSFIRRKL